MDEVGSLDALLRLINVGSSPGGARAKSLVAFDPAPLENRVPRGFRTQYLPPFLIDGLHWAIRAVNEGVQRMTVLAEYREARRGEDLARLRRVIALRAMLADGMSQQPVADELGVAQPAISKQLASGLIIGRLDAATVLEAGAPVLKALAADHGFTRIAVFGSVARGDVGPASDIDLLVEAPSGTSSLGPVRFQQLIEQVLGRRVDIVEYGGLKPGLDDDIRRDAVLL